MKKMGMVLLAAFVAACPLLAQDADSLGKTQPATKKMIKTVDDILGAGYEEFKVANDVDDELVVLNRTDLLLEVDIWQLESRRDIKPKQAKKIKVKPGKAWADNPFGDDIDDIYGFFVKVLSEEDIEILDCGKDKDDHLIELRKRKAE